MTSAKRDGGPVASSEGGASGLTSSRREDGMSRMISEADKRDVRRLARRYTVAMLDLTGAPSQAVHGQLAGLAYAVADYVANTLTDVCGSTHLYESGRACAEAHEEGSRPDARGAEIRRLHRESSRYARRASGRQVPQYLLPQYLLPQAP